MTSPLLDAKAAAQLLGVPASWVLAQARADRIPHVRFGRYVRFDEAEARTLVALTTARTRQWERLQSRLPLSGRATLETSPAVAQEVSAP